MVRGGPLVAVASVLGIALSGCAGLDSLMGEDGGGKGSLTRLVELDLSSSSLMGPGGPNDAADVLSIAKTRFEYTHAGPSVPADDLDVLYVDASGRERQAPLSDFTTADEVGKGDRVTIRDVLLTSRVEVRHGKEVLAARGLGPQEWLEASGYPLPIAFDGEGGRAAWDLDSDLRLTAALGHAEAVLRGSESDYVCTDPIDPEQPYPDCGFVEVQTVETMRIDGLDASARLDVDAVWTLADATVGSRPRLEAGLDGRIDVTAGLDVQVFHGTARDGVADEDPLDGRFGFDLTAAATGDGLGRLTFSPTRQLQAAGGEGALRVTADLTVWDDEHPKSAGWTPEDFPDPLLDVSSPYEETSVPGSDPVAFIAEALSDLWRMDLAAGDEFRLDSSGLGLGRGMPSAEVVIRVVGEEEKTVAAGTFDTLRVDTTMSVDVPAGGRTQTFDFPPTRLWIDRDSGVPVAFSQSLDLDYTDADFEGLLGLLEDLEDVELEGPDGLAIEAGGATEVRLREWDEGLRMAPMASVLAPFLGLGMPLGSFLYMPLGMMAGFGGLGGFGGDHDEDYGDEAAPDVSFNKDSSARTLTVVQADPGLSWSEFVFGGTCYGVLVNGEAAYMDPVVSGGDVLSGCSSGETLTITHWATNSLVYMTTFS